MWIRSERAKKPVIAEIMYRFGVSRIKSASGSPFSATNGQVFKANANANSKKIDAKVLLNSINQNKHPSGFMTRVCFTIGIVSPFSVPTDERWR